MSLIPTKKNLKGTWRQALLTFFGPVLLVFIFRLFILEPFVIPSGSMIPTLLIHDHLMVFKGSFGIKSPFSDTWWMRWGGPQRGDVVVFRYPKNPQVFYIKRVIGLPGDKLIFENHQLSVNGQVLPTEKWQGKPPLSEDDFGLFLEKNLTKSYVVRYSGDEDSQSSSSRIEVEVPEKNYYMMGDNRDQSLDSRVWGFLPDKYLVGRAWSIWLSCENTLLSAQMVCDPLTIRWRRIFKSVDKTIDIN
ncbi:MAG: signal peptidase I [Bdellovibrionota bacterium]